MKKLRFLRLARALSLAVLWLCGPRGFAQLPSGSPGGVNAALAKLFGATTAFTAKVEVQVLDPSQKESLRMPMSFADRNGKLRLEFEVAQIQSRKLSAKQVAEMKDAGLGRIVSIIRPDKKASYILYPGAQNFTIVPMPKAEADALGKDLKLEKTPLGQETIDGHPCVKNRVLVKDRQNVVLEATTWNATDLKDFPVQIRTKDKDVISILRFKQVQFAQPGLDLFEIPAGYKQSG